MTSAKKMMPKQGKPAPGKKVDGMGKSSVQPAMMFGKGKPAAKKK